MSFADQLPQTAAIKRMKRECHKSKHKRRGRPYGWRKYTGETEARTTIQVYHSFKEMLDFERKKGETNADTVRRLYNDLKKEIRILKGENQNY
jgi:hypothetical protein